MGEPTGVCLHLRCTTSVTFGCIFFCYSSCFLRNSSTNMETLQCLYNCRYRPTVVVQLVKYLCTHHSLNLSLADFSFLHIYPYQCIRQQISYNKLYRNAILHLRFTYQHFGPRPWRPIWTLKLPCGLPPNKG